MALYAFDGTWNTMKEREDATQHNTNVVKFHAAYQQASGKPQYYVAGVGTRWDKVGAVLGGAFGFGELVRLDEAYDALCANWARATGAEDREIDIVGFSRGAATALDFCHSIQDRGIRDPRSQAVVEPSPRIRFLGLWDTVASFGLANLGNAALNFGHHLEIPRTNIDYCFHALALDERRPSFLPIRLRGACEVWFRGVHSDIGGGNGNTDLSDITLKWMMAKARAAGLPIDDAEIPAWPSPVTAEPKPDHKLPIDVRTVGAVDRVHYSVVPLDEWTNPPATCPRETAIDEGTAQRAGDLCVVSLPLEKRRQLAVLLATAVATAKTLEITVDGPTYDELISVLESRLPLITSEAILETARQAIALLIERAASNARHAPFPTIAPVFLGQAMHELPGLFPLTD